MSAPTMSPLMPYSVNVCRLEDTMAPANFLCNVSKIIYRLSFQNQCFKMGGYLVEIDSEEETKFINRMIAATNEGNSSIIVIALGPASVVRSPDHVRVPLPLWEPSLLVNYGSFNQSIYQSTHSVIPSNIHTSITSLICSFLAYPPVNKSRTNT